LTISPRNEACIPGNPFGPDQAIVTFTKDTADLAQAYARSSGPQFGHGRLLLDSLGLRDGESVLDLGAGTGELARLAAEQVGPQGSVLALEPLIERVNLAQNQSAGQANLRFELGGSDDLGRLATSSMDVVVLNSVFHWIGDQPRLLTDLARLLKPGGRLGISTGIADRPHQQALLLAPLLAASGGGPEGLLSPPHRADASRLLNQLSAAGFGDIRLNVKTFVDHFADLAALLEWNSSSFFGNFLADVTPQRTPELWSQAERTLEAYRTSQGIRLERYLYLVTAVKQTPYRN
jgi:SAM-dependent methyltransferase